MTAVEVHRNGVVIAQWHPSSAAAQTGDTGHPVGLLGTPLAVQKHTAEKRGRDCLVIGFEQGSGHDRMVAPRCDPPPVRLNGQPDFQPEEKARRGR